MGHVSYVRCSKIRTRYDVSKLLEIVILQYILEQLKYGDDS